MFKKPFKITGNTKLKKALLKKVRVSAGKSLPLFDDLPEDRVGVLIASKTADFEITKLKGTRIAFYTHKECPVFIDVDGKGDLLPTLFGLWLVPEQILTLRVDDGAAPHLINGADLMAPGLQGAVEDLPDWEEGEYVAVAVPSGKAIAVGKTLIGSEELKLNGKRGKVVQVEHVLGDHLFLHAWCNSPSPYCSLPSDLEHLKDVMNLPARAEVVEIEEEEKAPEETEDQQDDPAQESEAAPAEEQPTEEAQANEEEDEEEEEEQMPAKVTLPMEELLKMSFLQGLKTTLNKEDLPIPGSVFYSLHMQPNAPPGAKIDIKRSSYKKLAKFLQAMARDQLVNVKPLPKGEIQIVSVNEKHADFVEFEPYKLGRKKKGGNDDSKESSGKSSSNEKGFTITPLLRPTADLFPVFSEVIEGADKATPYTRKDAMDTLWLYVAKKELAKSGRSADVTIDATLSRCFRKQKKEGDTTTKEDLALKFAAALQVNYEIKRDGVVNIVKNSLTPIELREEKRGGHKYVTRVKGLETYLLQPKDIAKDLRKRFAASSTVNELPVGKGKSATSPDQEVIIQGKMNHQIKDVLCKYYGIPAKHIELFSK